MSDNELTAEEREMVEHAGPGLPLQPKLLRLYDAALSRAEAAEEERDDAHKSADYWVALETKRDGQRKAAESRLAEANALLERWQVSPALDSDDFVRLRADTRTLLSATPAQAAEPDRPNDGRSGRCGIRVSGHHWCTLDHGHPGDHSTDEHPDTIALRECRAELGQTKTQLLEYVGRCAKCCGINCHGQWRQALVSRIAELESEVAPLRAAETRMRESDGMAAGNLALQTRIARAVAELEKNEDGVDPGVCLDAAMEALR